MPDFNDLMKQAKTLQEQMQKKQQEIANIVVEGESGAGLVRVSMNGRHDVKEVNIDDSLMSEDKEVLEDLIAAAVNHAVRKLEDQNKEMLGDITGGLNVPEGFKFPF